MEKAIRSRSPFSIRIIRVIFPILLMMQAGCGDDSLRNTDGAGSEELTAPVLISPVDGESVNTASPVFSWNSVPGAVVFELELDVSADFNEPLFHEELPVTSFMISDFPISAQTHFWRVRARSSTGVFGAWSNVFSFTLLIEDKGGELIASITEPSGGMTIFSDGYVDFAGSITGGNAVQSCSWDFGNGITIADMVDPPAMQFSDPGTYPVRFSAVGVDGNESSDESTITVVDDTPRAVGPAEGYVSNDGSAQFSWEPSSPADSYILRIEAQAGGNLEPLLYDVTGASHTVNGLSAGTYVWCVSGVDKEGNPSRCSVPRTLRVQLP